MSKNIKYPNESEFYDLLKTNSLVFVDFFASWCGPCKMLSPVVEQVADSFHDKVTFVKVDVDQHEILASQYNVTTIPTIVVIKDGQIVDQMIGYQGYPILEKMLTMHL